MNSDMKALLDYMQETGDPRAFGRGGIFGHYPVGGHWGEHLKGMNRFGKLETFPKSQYSDWMKENSVESTKKIK